MRLHRLFGAVIVLAVMGSTVLARAQENIQIQANVQGTGTQLGRVTSMNIFIEQVSSVVDQQALVDAFAKAGNKGLVEALTKMKPKGRISPTGSIGNDVKYIRELPSEKGRRFRLVTDRNLTFGELRNASRSSDYTLSGIEITITEDGKGSFGTLLPACRLMLNKKTQQLEIETLQNPWQLTNIVVHRKK